MSAVLERKMEDAARHIGREQGDRFDPEHGMTTVNDPRGLIESLCHEPVNSIIRIHSRPGSVRSNHYHLTDWHICYVESGSMDYYERPAGSTEVPACQHFRAGEWVRTGPMVEHTTIFPEQTVLLVFAGNKRDQDSYERDLVRSPDLSAV